MTTTEIFLIAIAIIFTVPHLISRVGNTNHYAPLMMVQIMTVIVLGTGILGKVFPGYYGFFQCARVQALSGIAWRAVVAFV
jgi:hypothetical protein